MLNPIETHHQHNKNPSSLTTNTNKMSKVSPTAANVRAWCNEKGWSYVKSEKLVSSYDNYVVDVVGECMIRTTNFVPLSLQDSHNWIRRLQDRVPRWRAQVD